ncbi:hypothetical protein MRX96_008880 [Rhipicephalus microplus]
MFGPAIEEEFCTIRRLVQSYNYIAMDTEFPGVIAQHNGNKPEGLSTWKFKFKFCLSKDVFAQDSINFLVRAGVMFRRHEEEGIEEFEFAQLLMTSGLVLSDEVKWLTFHTAHDFGYMDEDTDRSEPAHS